MNRIAKKAVVIATAIFYIICGIQCARADRDSHNAYDYCQTIRDDNYEGGDLWSEMDYILKESFTITDGDTICDWVKYDSLMEVAPYEHLLYE